MNQLTRQQIFDKVAEHLLTQMERSSDSEGVCLYRGPNGLMCAAGCLISNQEYDEIIEGDRIDSAVTQIRANPTQLEGLQKIRVACGIEGEKSFCRTLQRVHDEREPKDWENTLREIAEESTLEYKSYGPSKDSNIED